MQFEKRPLGEFVSLVSGNTPSKSNSSYWGGTIPWVSAKDMGDFWIEDSEDHLTESGSRVASRLVPPGTVLILTRGMTLHKRVPICRISRASTFNQDVKAVLPKGGLLARFLPYLLVGNHAKLHERVDSAGHGTGRLNTDSLLSLPVYVPRIAAQNEIADLGEAIDGRLRLLRQTNATLESIAQALFKSWFIDFDPVREKAEGREPEGMDVETAALFPDSFEDSALGEIPKGWRAATLERLIAIGAGVIQTGPFGSQLHASDYSDEGVPVAMPQDLEGRRISTTRIARVSDAHVERLYRHKLQAGDIVFSRRGDVGRHAAVTPAEAGWLCGTGCLLVRPGKKWPSNAYVSFALATEATSDWLHRHAVGATMPNLNTGILGSLPILLPTEPTLLAFEKIAGVFEARISENLAQTKTLAALRDTLLPRLISGKLRLPEAEAQLNEALA
ncbi:restriction endonuclease subunit S [Paraburkholderia unamae]|uniref:Type I restriction enzyme S subunit n=1 Tax=Paraburkholderia unamae TaxID=219649 RepID=A0ABX5KCJ8_9BURK|nr:restriction endonuclease subunit S [Paraburkholderia unamae]PVX74138.1 type I restriction enzyme S subunit [Paraburkholderia unamae]